MKKGDLVQDAVFFGGRQNLRHHEGQLFSNSSGFQLDFQLLNALLERVGVGAIGRHFGRREAQRLRLQALRGAGQATLEQTT